MSAVDVSARQRLDEALRDYIAECTDGAHLTEYFLVTASTSIEDFGTGRTIYTFVTPAVQAPHITIGLINYAADYGSVVDDDE